MWWYMTMRSALMIWDQAGRWAESADELLTLRDERLCNKIYSGRLPCRDEQQRCKSPQVSAMLGQCNQWICICQHAEAVIKRYIYNYVQYLHGRYINLEFQVVILTRGSCMPRQYFHVDCRTRQCCRGGIEDARRKDWSRYPNSKTGLAVSH